MSLGETLHERFQQSALEWDHPRRAIVVPPLVGLVCAVLAGNLPVALGDATSLNPLWFGFGGGVGYALALLVVAALD